MVKGTFNFASKKLPGLVELLAPLTQLGVVDFFKK